MGGGSGFGVRLVMSGPAGSCLLRSSSEESAAARATGLCSVGWPREGGGGKGWRMSLQRDPAHLRGRYMSIYWFGWGLARATSPLIGGFLNDAIAPRSIWIGGFLIGLTSVLWLSFLSRRDSAIPSAAPSPAG